MQLPPCYAQLDALDEASAWGTYAPYAAALRRALGKQASFTPLQVRLMVGLAGLGIPVAAVVSRFAVDHHVERLEEDHVRVSVPGRPLAKTEPGDL